MSLFEKINLLKKVFKKKNTFEINLSQSNINKEIDTDVDKKMYKTYNYVKSEDSPDEDTKEEFSCSLLGDEDIDFAKNFTELGGDFVYCKSETDFISNFYLLMHKLELKNSFVWEQELVNKFKEMKLFNGNLKCFRTSEQCEISIYNCESLVSSEGSIILNPQQNSPRNISSFPKNQIIIAYRHQLKNSIESAVKDFKSKFEVFPFLLQLNKNPKKNRNINGSLIINSESQNLQNIFVFFLDY